MNDKPGKLPHYARALDERQHCHNPPFSVFIHTGLESFERHKEWVTGPDCESLVYCPGIPPSEHRWPVKGCYCFIRWDTGPHESVIAALVQELRKAGAAGVCVQPLWVDESASLVEHNPEGETIAERWKDTRESIIFYPALGGDDHAT